MSISKQQFDAAYAAIIGHDGRMMTGFQQYFTVWQYWSEHADPKLKAKDVLAWELAATNAGAPVSSQLRNYARCGFVLDTVPAAGRLTAKELEKFAKLIELKPGSTVIWKNADHKAAVAAYAETSQGLTDDAKKESDRLQPPNRLVKSETIGTPTAAAVEVDFPTDPAECGKLIFSLVQHTTSPINTLGYALRMLAETVDVLSPAIAASTPAMTAAALALVGKDRAKELLLACIEAVGPDEVADMLGYNGPSPSIESIESNLVAA